MKITVYNDTGSKTSDVSISDKIFGVAPNKTLVFQALRRQQANARSAIAHVKNRSAVRGGGRKPFRQKGTGRARQGSTRSPLLRGGGVVFGPSNQRNFSIQMPKKQRRLALFSALSTKHQQESIFALEDYSSKEIKTKLLSELLKKLPVERSVLIVLDKPNEILQKSAMNIPNVKIILAPYLNVFDIMKYEKICFLKNALPVLESTFLS